MSVDHVRPSAMLVSSSCLTLNAAADLQVQPDLEELEVNMEDNEDAESNKSEIKLGKLQFSLDYDFQKGEVSSASSSSRSTTTSRRER